jgi:hypothetical protein
MEVMEESRVTPYVPKFKLCGLHHVGSMNPDDKEAFMANNEELDDNCPDYMFTTKDWANVYAIDIGTKTLYVDPLRIEDAQVTINIIQKLLDRFNKIDLIAMERCDTTTVDMLTSKTIDRSWYASVVDNRNAYIYRKRKLAPTPYKVENCTIAFKRTKECTTSMYGDHGTHTQYLYFTPDATYIQFDPPIFYARRNNNHCDLGVDMKNPFTETTTHPVVNRLPRWNKLSNKGYISIPNMDECVVRYCMIIPNTPNSYYPEETGMFIEYANATKKAIDDALNKNASIIQRNWKRAVSNPDYSVCKRRLLREFEEMP